jgi:hypothetical protein
MKMIPTLAVAALLGAGTAFAAAAPTATPAATAKPAAVHTRHASTMHCEKEARAKKLSGAEEKTFVRQCKEGKTS